MLFSIVRYPAAAPAGAGGARPPASDPPGPGPVRQHDREHGGRRAPEERRPRQPGQCNTG